MEGALVLSLDFELVWGVFDVVHVTDNKDYFLTTKKVIPPLLDIFYRFEVHATWATVGMLFNRNWEEWNNNKPEILPDYKLSQLSSYKFGESIQDKALEDICFAPDLIDLIIKAPGQELASHTYSHYYCLEEGQNVDSFSADIDKAVEMAENKKVSLNSLVFPRNQLKESYLKICLSKGITSVRSNPPSWYWKDPTSESILTKVARTGDAYFNFGKKSYLPAQLEKKEGFPLQQGASRFLRPVESNSFLRKRKLKRILSEMTTAAKNGEIYHLWWHPHNFGSCPEESIKDLETVLEHYERLKNEYNFRSLHMGEVEKSLLK